MIWKKFVKNTCLGKIKTMNKKYSSYTNGLKIGDLINYEYKNFPYLSYSSSKSKVRGDFGIVLDREFLFQNTTLWGPRKFFIYSIMNLDGSFYKLETKYIKILKRTGAL